VSSIVEGGQLVAVKTILAVRERVQEDAHQRQHNEYGEVAAHRGPGFRLHRMPARAEA